MDLYVSEKLLILVGVVLNVVLIVVCLRKLSFRRSMAPVFYLFALVSLLMSGLYWLTYEFLRPETRMPFAANEFGEGGGFLLTAAALNAVFRSRFSAARREMLCTAFFIAGSVVLWIAWSGEWLQDILAGLCFGYFLCVCARSLKLSRVLSRLEWCLLAGFAAALLILQGLTFVLPGIWSAAADYCAYAVMFAVLAYGLVKLIRALLRGGTPRGQFALGLSVWAWSVSTMYMSAGLFYLAASLIYIVCQPLILIALRREEAEA
jgi:hypothetical protein